MKLSDYVASFLRQQGVDCVYELSGGMITHLLDSISKVGGIQIISMHHEQGAAFAAEGGARMTGIPGVALATSGPGATNLITGIGSCYFDSVPAVFITGQVNLAEQKGDRAIRQLGFQETDIVAMVGPITKAAWRVRSPEEMPGLLERAFKLAVAGRPGPVLLDIPMDVQRMNLEAPPATRADTPAPLVSPQAAGFVRGLLTALAKARRPLILTGGGIRSSQSTDRLRAVVDQLGIPVVHSLMGVDCLPYSHPLRVGLIGSYGNRWANHAIGSSDLLLVLGSRLDIRQTGADIASFKGARQIFHIDCEGGELGNRVPGCEILCMDLRPFLDELRAQAKAGATARPDWLAELRALQAKWPDTWELRDFPGINPNVFVHELSRASRQATAFVADVGQHQMWAAQSLELTATQRFLTSGGMGSMGFGLPAAIGACFAPPRSPAVLIAGDGGFQSNLQELQTVIRNKLPLKIVILNNQCHGMVRQFQESYFHGHYQSTLLGYSAPDFAKVAESYLIPGRTVATQAEVAGGLAWLWAQPDSPALLQVMVDTHTNTYPKMAFGRPFTEMEPMAKPLDMEGT